MKKGKILGWIIAFFSVVFSAIIILLTGSGTDLKDDIRKIAEESKRRKKLNDKEQSDYDKSQKTIADNMDKNIRIVNSMPTDKRIELIRRGLVKRRLDRL